MTRPRTHRSPGFFWQGLLILLPVAVLAVVGTLSLRQDKVIAEHGAAERAQTIADDLATRAESRLMEKAPEGPAFEVDSGGQLIFPPAAPTLPVPRPLNPDELTPDQRQLWLRLSDSGAAQTTAETRRQDLRDFIRANPPDRFAAIARYELGLLLARDGKLSEALEWLDQVSKNYPATIGESGLPLLPLAGWKRLELETAAPGMAGTGSQTLDGLCSNLVSHPTVLTPRLLQEVEILSRKSNRADHLRVVQKWRRLWETQELDRTLYAAARRQLLAETNSGSRRFQLTSGSSGAESPPALFPRLFWFTTPNALLVVENQSPGSETNRVQSGGTRIGSKVHTEDNYVGVMTYTTDHSTATNGWIGRVTLAQEWLAITTDPVETNRWFVCRSQAEIENRLDDLLRTRPIPEYLAGKMEVARRPMTTLNSDLRVWYYYAGTTKGGGYVKKGYTEKMSTQLLASTAKSELELELVKVGVYLTSPSALYRQQAAHVFWFGAAVAASTLAAVIGLLTAWRAFRQQRRLNELKSNFVSSVSHELRAPIASVRLMAENLESAKVPQPDKQKEYFHFIVQECRRLSSLIENVLDFSRIEQGRKQYEFEPTDVLALVQKTMKLMELRAAEKGVVLKLETSNLQPPTSNIEMEIDGRAIQQALVNLIDNAIKHSPKGEVVTVEIEVQSPASKFLVVPSTPGAPSSTLWMSVSDQGPGIPPAEHERIFERFYRRGSELRRETQGVGIGLSIVKHIVEAHGGRVRVDSYVGRGSRFTIELPVGNHHE